MVERALLFALVALAVVLGASAIATSFHKMTDRIECAFDRASICVLDDAKEQ